MDYTEAAVGNAKQIQLIEELADIIIQNYRNIRKDPLLKIFQNKIRYQLAGEYGTRLIDTTQWSEEKQIWFFSEVINQTLFDIDLNHDYKLFELLEARIWIYLDEYY
jgi:hypothetical protein